MIWKITAGVLCLSNLVLCKELHNQKMHHAAMMSYLARMLDEHNIPIDEFDILALNNLAKYKFGRTHVQQ
jgi:hypothetical protein